MKTSGFKSYEMKGIIIDEKGERFMAGKCEETGCREKAIYKIGKRQFLNGRPLERRRWMSVCATHEYEIGNANEKE